MQTDDENQSSVGRPTKYSQQTIDRVCKALADGMPIKSSCIAAGIGVTTLNEWRDKYPEIEERMNQARERFREKALPTIKKAIDNDDWRVAVAALKLVFPEYRESSKVDVTATAQVSTLVLTEEMRLKLIERREKALPASKDKLA